MAALTQDRNTPEAIGDVYIYGLKADAVLHAGALACLDATGFLVPGVTATGLTAVGRCEKRADNTGAADGTVQARVRRGVFLFANAAPDAITRADVGADCYIVDDQTVAKTDGAGTRSLAGKVVQVEATGVWVKVGIF